MTPTILFFDLDGTLMVNPFWKVVFPTVSADLAAQTGRSAEEVFAAIMAEHDARVDSPLPNKPQTMDWEEIFSTVAGRLGARFDGSAEAMVIAHAAPPYTSTIDHAERILPQLRAAHRRLVVATMGLSKYQVPVLKGLGLFGFFDAVLTPDRTGFLKTERGFYADYLGEPALRIHIGDRHDHDCAAPKAFGTRAVLRLPIPELAAYDPFERPQHLEKVKDQVGGVQNGQLAPLPDAVVLDLAELPGVIARLEGAI